MFLTLKNPHSLWATFERRPRDILSITFPKKRSLKKVSSQGGGPPLTEEEAWSKIQRRADPLGLLHFSDSEESPYGTIRPKEMSSLPGFFRAAGTEASAGYGLWMVLDQIQDPHNLGALFRSAAFFGIHGIVLTKHRTSPLSAVVYDVACGGIEEVPFLIQTNLQSVFESAKEAGCWILGTSEHASRSYLQVQRDRSWVLVVGNEGDGIRRLTEASCDEVCRIPAQGRVASLNVSVASGVLLSYLKG